MDGLFHVLSQMTFYGENLETPLIELSNYHQKMFQEQHRIFFQFYFE